MYEFIPNGTVADHIHGHQTTPGSLTWPTRMSIAIETASALEMKYFFFFGCTWECGFEGCCLLLLLLLLLLSVYIKRI